jgi:hypothetical protein
VWPRTAEHSAGVLCDLTASSKRLALVGLAKNTGKTVALSALLSELEGAGRRVGVTSVGRDGEQHDVIDSQIEKPLIRLAGGSLVATTDSLLRASGIPHELLEETDVRTPLGRVLIARLRGPGAIEVAGPSASEQVRGVAEAMLDYGAEQVLIDGAIDRRAASSPEVTEGLVMSTGAVLSEDISEVVALTKDAVELVRLPLARDMAQALALPPRFALTAEGPEIAQLLDEHPSVERLTIAGALPDRFLQTLLQALARRRREMAVVAGDPTKVFLSKQGPSWYERQGLRIETLRPIELAAITVNPVAPRSHRFDPEQLQALLREAIEDVPIFDVLGSGYAEAAAPPLAK